MDKKEITNRFLRAWTSVPSLRFGQFMWNIQKIFLAKGSDTFYISDEELIKKIEEMVKKLTYHHE